MKGIGDIGAIEELEKCGVIAQLEEVAGSSAGGLVATLLAIGCTAKEIREEMLKIDFKAFQDKREPGWIESARLKGVGGSVKSTKDKLDLIRRSPIVSDALASAQVRPKMSRGAKAAKRIKTVFSIPEKIEAAVGLALGSDLGLWEGEALSYFLSELVARKTGNPNITFRELAELAKTDSSQFKQLTLTGSNITDGKLEYYNARNTPDMPIVQAARISASFPGAFKPVIMEGEDGQKKVKVDGGLLENLPDVFNKPPYVTSGELTKNGGNPRAFALVFREKSEKDPKKIENGIDLAKALFAAKMSEVSLYKKYGHKIAFIDPRGMGTLEFSAPMHKREALAQSGAVATRRALGKILMEEARQAHLEYEKMSAEELIRQEMALGSMAEKEHDQFKIAEELVKIQKELERRGISEDELEELQIAEKKCLDRRRKRMDPIELSDDELIHVCGDKIRELMTIGRQLRVKVRNLELAKNAIRFNANEIISRFEEYNGNNDFYRELQELKRMEGNINANRVQKSKFRDNPAKNKILDTQYAALKAEREQYLTGLIKKYQSRQDTLLEDFFKDIKEDWDKPGFSIPVLTVDLEQYCLRDVETCESFIEKSKVEMEKLRQELVLFKKYQKSFSERTDKSHQFSELLNFKKELDRTIYNRTTFLAKLDHYLFEKFPRFERAIAPFLKVVSFVGFITWLPLAMPTVGIAKAVSYFSKNPKIQTTADRVIKFFHWTNIDFDKKLHVLKDETARFIKRMSDDYVDSGNVACLSRLYHYYLKASGIALQDVFTRNPNETVAQYKKRLARVQRQLEVDPSYKNGQRAISSAPSAGRGTTKEPLISDKADQKLETFRREVLESVARTTSRERVYLAESSAHYTSATRRRLATHQKVRTLHLQCLQAQDDALRDLATVSALRMARTVTDPKPLQHPKSRSPKDESLRFFLSERRKMQHNSRGKLDSPYHSSHRRKAKPK
jgi:predicted acylesterase/phospholipase RssA